MFVVTTWQVQEIFSQDKTNLSILKWDSVMVIEIGRSILKENKTPKMFQANTTKTIIYLIDV